ncbi:hypothetical protein ACG2F4_07250 [Halalkalibaculum sp. DA3122]
MPRSETTVNPEPNLLEDPELLQELLCANFMRVSGGGTPYHRYEKDKKYVRKMNPTPIEFRELMKDSAKRCGI